MPTPTDQPPREPEGDVELQEWLESLDDVVAAGGPRRAGELLRALALRAAERGIAPPPSITTPYVNTIPPADEPRYPGDRALEQRIKSVIRWNAMAMVVRANRDEHGIGGHISTYASAATLYEVAFNHFLRGRDHPCGGDLVYFQGHAAPGLYARAFVEGRLAAPQLDNFRRELRPGGGLSSYPHPWLMPDFWQFPTVSMGLGPILSIYQARYDRYLVDRGLLPETDRRVWAFVGDGEADEPETLGALTLAAREHLDNLIWVVNCNLQRLDGPVRGNGNIIQELEAAFRGAGWHVVKVIWGSAWDPLLANDKAGKLRRRMGEVVDGEYQKYEVESGAYMRERFFATDPELLALVQGLSDDQLRKLNLGGHDPQKVHAAYAAAVRHRGAPTVILARTVKGYGLGESGEGRNMTHQQKQLNEVELRRFRTRFGIPLSDEQVAAAPFYLPPEESPERQYLEARRAELGGYLPHRRPPDVAVGQPAAEVFDEYRGGSGGREVSTTMVTVGILAKLLRHPDVGKYIVPIVPDEARTFGMEPLIRQVGIYSHVGQLYEPVDAAMLLYYREDQKGQILEEGITEAGAMASFIAAGTAASTHGVPTIPFFLFYSMFGFQRIGDLIWAGADARARGFLIGGTAGRTTLAGEGLQHQDGNSQLLALPVPTIRAYDPAFAYELATIVREGLRRMFEQQESTFYYLTVGNENYAQPPMPGDVSEGILRGLYRFRAAEVPKPRAHAQLLASGALVNEALRAQALLADRFGVAADVWSATSLQQLYTDTVDCERWNRLHPDAPARVPYARAALAEAPGAVVMVSDYVKALPAAVAAGLGRPAAVLGTDGFGRSDSRRALRDFFEVDARYIAAAALHGLTAPTGPLAPGEVAAAVRSLDLNPEKRNPRTT
jgi:pyruvate dehydrogenase E1 component